MDHLKDLSEARKLASIARVNYDVMKVFIDMKRSELSYSKAEMSIR
jgi:inorganic pyrophosphatase/exopolyphosphatase